jgi:PBP1b-binding outer membrane lipoprotein LpoB
MGSGGVVKIYRPHLAEWFIMLVPLMVLALLASGCQHTPQQQVADARAVYVAGLHEINVLHRAGVISVDDKVKMAPTTQAIANALDAADVLAAEGKNPQGVLLEVNTLIDALLRANNIDPVTLKPTKK